MAVAKHGISFFSCSTVLLLTCSIVPAGTIDVEVGREVGDGLTRYNAPYDPKDVNEVTFVSPTIEHPFYEIALPLGDLNEGPQTMIKGVRVNAVESDSFYVFVDGFSRSQDQTVTRTGSQAKNVVVVTRSAWHDGEPTTIEVDLGAGEKRTTRTFQATAPAKGGVPAGWRRYQSLLLQESAGTARINEPVEFSITERAEYVNDLSKELRVFQVDSEKKSLEPVPFQIFNAQKYAGSPPDTTNPNYIVHPAKSVEVVILANVPARQSRVYVVVYDNPSAEVLEPAKTDLRVNGRSLETTVENKFYSAKMFEKSGCLSEIRLKPEDDRSGPILTNSASMALHYNPDAYGDNLAWGHTYGWDPPERVVVAARGPLLFRITMSGRMPSNTPHVHASVSYSFYAGTPYIRTTTIMQVRDPYVASALRNGEFVLDSHLVDHFVWEEKTGDLKRMQTLHGPNFQDEWTTRVDHDVHWLAMTSEADGYGLGVAVAESLAFNPEHGEATTHRPAYYLYYHHTWSAPLTYFTRAWVYPFSDYQKGPNLPVTPGSTYLERMGLMPFYLHQGDDHSRYKDIATVGVQLRHPLAQRWGR